MTHAAIPHFEWPFHIVPVHGHASVMEQDSAEDVETCLAILFQTQVGSRVEEPDYGIDPVLFRDELDMNSLIASVMQWESRALIAADESFDATDRLIRRVLIQRVQNRGE
jgi:phage baseplate assembly protein W